jgi:endogenous inhibitor of DNA gyrase (YacG/DUF329 family)
MQRTCENKQCGNQFHAREADVKRGWGRFCSKRCKAIKQEQRTGQWAAMSHDAREMAGLRQTNPVLAMMLDNERMHYEAMDDAFDSHGQNGHSH